MSKLLEKLKRVAQSSGPAMGFAASARTMKEPTLVLIADLSLAGNTLLGAAVEAGAEAVVLPSLPPQKKTQHQTIIGCTLETISDAKVSDLSNSGVDFVLCRENTPAALLNWEQVGILVSVSADASDSLLGSLGTLGIDGALLDLAASQALTLHDLASVQRVSLLLGRPLVVRVGPSIGSGELQTLRDVGIPGIVVDVTSNTVASVQRLHQAILELPPRQKRRKEPREALLPLHEMISPPHEEEEEALFLCNPLLFPRNFM